METRTARLRHVARSNPYYVPSGRKGVLLGYRRVSKGNGSWIVKRLIERTETGGHYVTEKLGEADDFADSDGASVLTYFEAIQKVSAQHSAVQRRLRYTVVDAARDHIAWLKIHRNSWHQEELNLKAYALPYFGDRLLTKITAKDLEDWLAWALEHRPKGRRKQGLQCRMEPTTRIITGDAAERLRRRRSTLNRVITSLKAMLTRAFMNGFVDDDLPWRRLRKFTGVDVARVKWLTTDQCTRLVNAAHPQFRPIVHAALLTGARWGELRALKVVDFDPVSATVNVQTSKSGKPRRIYLTADGAKAFAVWTVGRDESAALFTDANGNAWGDHDQHRRMVAACKAARIAPAVGFHILRHSYASALAQKGVSLAIVAEALGHADTRMVSKHYGHLAPSHVANAIRANLPALDVIVESDSRRLRR